MCLSRERVPGSEVTASLAPKPAPIQGAKRDLTCQWRPDRGIMVPGDVFCLILTFIINEVQHMPSFVAIVFRTTLYLRDALYLRFVHACLLRAEGLCPPQIHVLKF